MPKKRKFPKTFLKTALHIAAFVILSAGTAHAYEEFGEIGDPTMAHGVQAMRSFQVHYTNFLFYTMNMQTPGAVEIGCYNARLSNPDGSFRIDYVPFYRFRAGPAIDTERELDFYVDGNRCFFVVQLATSLGYTRDGRFNLDSQRRLVTQAGSFPVLGENGPIILPPGNDITVSRSGIIFVDGQPVDRMKIIVFASGFEGQKMELLNAAMFVLTEEAETLEGPEHYAIKQGMLHENNILKALNGDMLFARQGYDASVKTVQTLAKAAATISSLGSQ